MIIIQLEVNFNYTILTNPNPTSAFIFLILTNKDRTMAQDMQSYVQRNDYSGAIKSFSALELQVLTSQQCRLTFLRTFKVTFFP